jgi:hypothetical protein
MHASSRGRSVLRAPYRPGTKSGRHVIELQVLGAPRPRVQVHIDRGDTNETSDGGYTTSERWPIHTKAGVGRILSAIGWYRGPTEGFRAQWVAMMGKADFANVGFYSN